MDECVVADPTNDSRWSTFVSNHPLATAYHGSQWLSVIEDTFGYRPVHRLYLRDGVPVAAVPLFSIRTAIGRDYVNPFCSYGFPLLGSDGNSDQVLESLRSIPGPLETLIIKESIWTQTAGYHEWGYGGVETGVVYRLPLESGFDTLWEDVFDSGLRQNVRQSERSGVKVSRSEDVSLFYSLYLATMRRKGSPQFPERLFEKFHDIMGDDIVLFIARRDGDPIGGLLGFDYKGTRYLWSNGSKAAEWEARPNDALYTAAIESACKAGLDVVDFGRTEPNSGVDRFKRRFGAEVFTLTSLVFPSGRTSRADLSGYRRFENFTRYLAPLLTHPALGPWLKKHIHE